MADDAEHRVLRRRQIERRQLFGTMTVEENLRMGAYTSPDRAAALADLHAQFDRFLILRERRHQLAQTLSGREQQIVAIARAALGIADRGYVMENGRTTRIVRAAADNVHRFHNPKLADPASAQDFVSREFHPGRYSSPALRRRRAAAAYSPRGRFTVTFGRTTVS